MEFKRFAAVLMLVIMLIAIASVPVLASTNEKVIFKNSDNEYLIYYKEFYKKNFNLQLAQTKVLK